MILQTELSNRKNKYFLTGQLSSKTSIKTCISSRLFVYCDIHIIDCPSTVPIRPCGHATLNVQLFTYSTNRSDKSVE